MAKEPKTTNETPQAGIVDAGETVFAENPTRTDAPAPTPGPEKVTGTGAAPAEIVRDTVDASTGPTGEVRSATIEAEPQRHLSGAALGRILTRPETIGSYAGTLPARSRVLASGEEQTLSAKTVDGSERTFTAAIRILKAGKLYEPGAPVPLTSAEFDAKRQSRAIEETSFSDGAFGDA